MWQGPHGRTVAQPLKERVWFDYHLSTTWAQLMSVQGYNTFIHTRLLGNKWQYENDSSDVIGVCTKFIWNNKVTTTEWLQLAQQWQMIWVAVMLISVGAATSPCKVSARSDMRKEISVNWSARKRWNLRVYKTPLTIMGFWVLCSSQGVVTPMLHIDTLATGIKMFDRENNALIPWFPF